MLNNYYMNRSNNTTASLFLPLSLRLLLLLLDYTRHIRHSENTSHHTTIDMLPRYATHTPRAQRYHLLRVPRAPCLFCYRLYYYAAALLLLLPRYVAATPLMLALHTLLRPRLLKACRRR